MEIQLFHGWFGVATSSYHVRVEFSSFFVTYHLYHITAEIFLCRHCRITTDAMQRIIDKPAFLR